MTEFLTPTDVFGSPVETYPTPTLGLEMVGALIMKPPQTADDHSPAFVVPYGILLDRSTYSILWLTAQRLGWVQSEANWQAAKTLSATGSVSFYSDGTDGTNFRIPDIGESGGFPRLLGSNGLASVGGIETGFDWQIENITGKFHPYTNNTIPAGGAFTRGTYSSIGNGTANEEPTELSIIDFDASLVVKAGDETTPQGFYQKPFIYTGADITTPAAAPSLEQIIMAAMQPKLLWNTDFSSPNVVNQKNFNGDWSSIAVDEQGYDLWRKYDENNIFQVVPEGSYLPNHPHILQYNGVAVWKGNSPASGNWGVVVPNTANKIDLRAGYIKAPYHPEDVGILRQHCLEQYFNVLNHVGCAGYMADATSYVLYYQHDYPTKMVSVPVITLTPLGAGGSGTTFSQQVSKTERSVRLDFVNSGTLNRINLTYELRGDATLKQPDVANWLNLAIA